MNIIKKRGVARLESTDKEEQARRAKQAAISALKEFLATPDDAITLKLATRAIKNVTTILLQE